MQLPPRKRGRWLWRAAMFIVLAMSAVWAYFIVTRDPLSAAYYRLRPNLTRAQVEKLIGGPAPQIQEIRGNNLVYADYDSGDSFGWPPRFPDAGKLTNDVSAIKLPTSERRPITAEHTWDGPEGCIIAAFDSEDRLMAVWFIHRVTFRYKMQRWMPWLR